MFNMQYSTSNSGNIFHAIFLTVRWMINIMQSLRSESNILMTSANLSKFNVSTYFISVRYNDCDCDAPLSINFVKISNHLIPYWLPLAQKRNKCMFELLRNYCEVLFCLNWSAVTPSKLTPNWILTSPVKCNSCKRKQNGLRICIVDPS